MRRFAIVFACGYALAPGALAVEDCNGNGSDDAADIAGGGSTDLNADGVPDECQRCSLHESWRLALTNPAAGDRFGFSVSLDGDTAIFGAPYRDSTSADAGAAFVHRLDAGVWTQRAELHAADGASFDHFGNGVALSGNVAVVGAPDDDSSASNTGSAHVFRFNGSDWNFEAKLVPPDPQFNARFGDAVSVHGDHLLVGALGADGLGGAVYAYRYHNGSWTLLARLMSNDRAAGDRFGQRVALGDSVAVISAAQDDDNGSNSGSAYVFRFTDGAWNQEAKLRASDAAASDLFGTSVAVDGDWAVVGAPDDDDGGSNSGSAYVFQHRSGGWVQTAKLRALDRAAGDNFGEALALKGDTLLVAAVGDDDRGSGSGSVYLYERGGKEWRMTAKFSPSDGQAGDFMGSALAVDGDTALVAAWEDDDAGFASGVAYTLQSVGDCNGDGRLDLCSLQSEISQDANLNGLPDECDADCNSNEVPDDLDLSGGASSDCNGNGTPDECDISAGFSRDCNKNGVPDECDRLSGTSGDCNQNGIPDECDTASGESRDCDGNGAPDECATDSDGDGVIDGCDLCENTAMGATVDANGCPPPPAMADLMLSSVCAGRPGVERRWRVDNPNGFVVTVHWGIDNASQEGALDAGPGESFFLTEAIDGSNVASMKWFDPTRGVRMAVAVSTAGACPGSDADADGVPDADDWCPQSEAGAAVDEHGCAAGQLVAVCHTSRENPEKRETIHVAPAAVRAHLRHGDVIGPCELPAGGGPGNDSGTPDGEDEGSDDTPDRMHGEPRDHDGRDGNRDERWKESEDRGEEGRDDDALPGNMKELLDGTPVHGCGTGAAGAFLLLIAGFVAGSVRSACRRCAIQRCAAERANFTGRPTRS